MKWRETLIEFYEGTVEQSPHPFAHVKGGDVPRAGEFVSIKGKVYQVERVTWALDQAGTSEPTWRANVEMRRA